MLTRSITGVFVSTIFVGAFAFGVGFDVGITSFWDYWNRGVRLKPSVVLALLAHYGTAETMEGHP